MKRLIDRIRGLRLWALIVKELGHIKRDRQLISMLIVPPTIQLIVFGVALNPEVTGLRLGVVDESRAAISRDLISAFTESRSFEVAGQFGSDEEMGRELSAGNLDAGLIIPSDFARRRARGETAEVQLLVDGVNSNTAGIAAGYCQRIIASVNQGIGAGDETARVTARVALMYNPGLKSSWFMLTGVMGILLVLNGSLVAAGSMVKEKEAGTVEQLLMT
ncbi:MAG TPA: ABC transporter permease, partial [Blastocatellia bacterium]|nr:ABC transporter permease [Blastocatellia bacterium]